MFDSQLSPSFCTLSLTLKDFYIVIADMVDTHNIIPLCWFPNDVQPDPALYSTFSTIVDPSYLRESQFFLLAANRRSTLKHVRVTRKSSSHARTQYSVTQYEPLTDVAQSRMGVRSC